MSGRTPIPCRACARVLGHANAGRLAVDPDRAGVSVDIAARRVDLWCRACGVRTWFTGAVRVSARPPTPALC